MKDKILAKLNEIERIQNVRILLSVESGSRAWGFASPDSDYDVRFIYVRPMKDYLRLDKVRDVIELPIEDELDISGWDLSKALTLMRSSNPTLFEWLCSPIVYLKTDIVQKLTETAEHCFSIKISLYHYLNMAKKAKYDSLTDNTIKIKKYCYILRALLACRWILDTGTMPPVLFETLKESCLPKELCPPVEKLLEKKIHSPEIKKIEKIPEIDGYIEHSIAQIEKEISLLEHPQKEDWSTLNHLFLMAVGASE